MTLAELAEPVAVTTLAPPLALPLALPLASMIAPAELAALAMLVALGEAAAVLEEAWGVLAAVLAALPLLLLLLLLLYV